MKQEQWRMGEALEAEAVRPGPVGSAGRASSKQALVWLKTSDFLASKQACSWAPPLRER